MGERTEKKAKTVPKKKAAAASAEPDKKPNPPGLYERQNKGKTTFQVKVRGPDGKWASQSFKRKTDALARLHELRVEIAAGQQPKQAADRKRTLGDLIDRYVAEVIPKKKTWAKLQGYQLERWRAELGTIPVVRVTPAAVAEVRDRLERDVISEGQGKGRGKIRSPGSVNRYLAALSHLFTVAIKRWQWADDNPVGKIEKAAEDSRHETRLEVEEAARLLEACRASTSPYLYAVVTLALHTGMRRGEILGLRLCDLDFRAKTALLTKTKNGKQRRVALDDDAIAVLRDYLDAQPAPASSSERVFYRTTNIGHAFKAAVKAAGLGHFRLHDLRHAAASFMLDSDETELSIAKTLGHSTLQMVLRYAHAREVVGRSAVSKVAARLRPERPA